MRAMWIAVPLIWAVSGTSYAQTASTDWWILQSSADPLALLVEAPSDKPPGGRVMASSDCREMRPGLYIRAIRPTGVTPPAGAYAKRCTPKPNSLAAYGIPAVDPSFAGMRTRPVTFSGLDVVSTIRSGLLLRPYYEPSSEDPREGLRVAIEDIGHARRMIERDCMAPEVARSRTHIAIACAVEQVAEQPVYRTTVYRARDLARIQSVPRCGKPQLVGGGVRCAVQTISDDGKVETSSRVTSF